MGPSPKSREALGGQEQLPWVAFQKLFTRRAPRRGQARGERPRENQENSGEFFIFPLFFKVFQTQILRKYPRRSCGSIWSGLELRRPKFDRFRPNFPNLFMKMSVFLKSVQFFATRIASWRPKTLPKRKISQFSYTLWS